MLPTASIRNIILYVFVLIALCYINVSAKLKYLPHFKKQNAK